MVVAGLPVANQSYDSLAAAPKVTPVMIPKIFSDGRGRRLDEYLIIEMKFFYG